MGLPGLNIVQGELPWGINLSEVVPPTSEYESPEEAVVSMFLSFQHRQQGSRGPGKPGKSGKVREEGTRSGKLGSRGKGLECQGLGERVWKVRE